MAKIMTFNRFKRQNSRKVNEISKLKAINEPLIIIKVLVPMADTGINSKPRQ